MRAKRADGGVEPRLCYLPSTPQSPRDDSSPSGEPFGILLPPSQSCPRLRGKWHEVPKGERFGDANCRKLFPPQLRLRSAERWLEYGRLAALPLAILPIPPDSPLAASPTGRARLESPFRAGLICKLLKRTKRLPVEGAVEP